MKMELTKGILALRRVASTEVTRSNLQGVRFADGKAVATSGYILAVLPTVGGGVAPCTVSSESLEALDKLLSAENAAV